MRPDGGRRVLGSGAVMFPISLGRGVVADRILQPDDIAGVSDLYPDAGFRADTGIVAGRVRLNGVAVKGAHVVAFNPRTGSLIGNFSGSRRHLPDRWPDAWSTCHSRGAARRWGYRQLPRTGRASTSISRSPFTTGSSSRPRRSQRKLRRRGAARNEFSSAIAMIALLPAVVSDVLSVLVSGPCADAQVQRREPIGRLSGRRGRGLAWRLGIRRAAGGPAGRRRAAHIGSSNPTPSSARPAVLRGACGCPADTAIWNRRPRGDQPARSSQTIVSSDAEPAGSFTLAESIDQYVFDGGIVIRLDEWETWGLVPFASAGVGYVRQLHEEQRARRRRSPLLRGRRASRTRCSRARDRE